MAASESFLYRVFRDTELLNKRTILDLLEPRPGGTMLDCGCGDGSFTAELAARSKSPRCMASKRWTPASAPPRRAASSSPRWT